MNMRTPHGIVTGKETLGDVEHCSGVCAKGPKGAAFVNSLNVGMETALGSMQQVAAVDAAVFKGKGGGMTLA